MWGPGCGWRGGCRSHTPSSRSEPCWGGVRQRHLLVKTFIVMVWVLLSSKHYSGSPSCISRSAMCVSLQMCVCLCVCVCVCARAHARVRVLVLYALNFQSTMCVSLQMCVCLCVCVRARTSACARVVCTEFWKYVNLKNVEALRACAG